MSVLERHRESLFEPLPEPPPEPLPEPLPEPHLDPQPAQPLDRHAGPAACRLPRYPPRPADARLAQLRPGPLAAAAPRTGPSLPRRSAEIAAARLLHGHARRHPANIRQPAPARCSPAPAHAPPVLQGATHRSESCSCCGSGVQHSPGGRGFGGATRFVSEKHGEEVGQLREGEGSAVQHGSGSRAGRTGTACGGGLATGGVAQVGQWGGEPRCSTRRCSKARTPGQQRRRHVVQRAAHSATAQTQDMRVDHRRADIGMAQQFLYRANVVARLQKMGGKRVSQSVR